MRTISVYLDDKAEEILVDLMEKNECSISDVMLMGLYTIAQSDAHPVMIRDESLYGRLKRKIKADMKITPEEYCYQRDISRKELGALCRRIERGASVKGFGDNNKWRNKQDDRTLKTKTARMVRLIYVDLKVDLENF